MAAPKSAPISLPGAPPAVTAALERLVGDLTKAAGDNFAGLVLYGGLARGRYRPGKSDVNVVVLLGDAGQGALAAVAGALRAARRSAGIEAMLLTPSEIPSTADAFPTKFLDIKEHHVLLAGSDPFTGLEVTCEQIRRRAEQELRNLLLRLRHAYVALGGDGVMAAQALARTARPFALELAALMRCTGKPLPAEDRTAPLFAAAADAFSLEREPLARLAELRQNPQPIDGFEQLFAGVMRALQRAADFATSLKGKVA